MLTTKGLAWVAALTISGLEGATMLVGDGEQSESVPIDSLTYEAEDKEVVARATFGEGQANFEWKVRAVVLPDGTDVDRLEEDQGRKAPGSIWVLEARIQLEAA